ncbi:MAG: carboxypeptidase regulatory-like domain-containing protein [Planctomycetes bacterium]|nr:carboxypeptidase regulatory-like domain-containing protein [Planctomycetota bacterium]
MKQSRILMLLLAMLALAVACAWLVFQPDDPKPAVSAAQQDQGACSQSPDPAQARADDADTQAQATPVVTLTEQEKAAAEQARAAETAGTQGSAGSAPAGTQPAASGTTGNTPQTGASGSTPKGTETRRPPTPREREEERRRTQGRPALAERMSRSPGASGSNASLAKSPVQEKWDEQWTSEGITPPPMTPTPVTGKVMSEQSREGLGNATVHLMTFFPLDGIAGGPLLPVVSELVTDEQGNFSGEVPASKLVPQSFPVAAIGISWDSKRILAAQPLTVLEAGKQNALGIFWAPDYPYTLKCDARQFTGTLSVISTGEINPQRVHTLKRTEFLASFPAFNVTAMQAQPAEGAPEPGYAQLIGTWGTSVLPYISLRDGSALLRTQRPKLASVVSNGGTGVPQQLPAPFDTLVFTNEAYKPIGGMVIDSEGAPISGAVVATQGGAIGHSAVTDVGGWFFIDNPDEKTSSLRVTHDQYIEVLHATTPGNTDLRITMAKHRPRVRLHVTDRVTVAPITELTVNVIGLYPWGKNKGKPMPEAFVNLTASDGHFVLDWEYEIRSVTLEKLGYFPKFIDKPSTTEELPVELSPGRNLEIQPRNYSAVEQTDRWFPDANQGPGIYTAWSHHWIEYEVDFGDAPAQGEQGGFFDIVLGCTNRGIVDNEYRFSVDVYVDDVKKKTLTIMADSLTIREDRASLGALSGVHRIRLVWTNDKWIPDQLDANIRYATLKFLEQPK